MEAGSGTGNDAGTGKTAPTLRHALDLEQPPAGADPPPPRLPSQTPVGSMVAFANVTDPKQLARLQGVFGAEWQVSGDAAGPAGPTAS